MLTAAAITLASMALTTGGLSFDADPLMHKVNPPHETKDGCTRAVMTFRNDGPPTDAGIMRRNRFKPWKIGGGHHYTTYQSARVDRPSYNYTVRMVMVDWRYAPDTMIVRVCPK